MANDGKVVSLIQRLRQRTRTARLARFKSFVSDLRRALPDGDRILRVVDIGGTVAFWEDWWKLSDQDQLHVTLINNHRLDDTQRKRQTPSRFIDNVCRDANTLTPADFGAFDLIFSNSFLEHLRSRGEQTRLADTIAASGLPYFVQVPNKHSPVDPHHPFAPYFAVYPFTLRVGLVRVSGFGAGGKARTLDDAREREQYYNPLGVRDMQALFPKAAVKVEKPLGVPMSILALYLADSPWKVAPGKIISDRKGLDQSTSARS